MVNFLGPGAFDCARPASSRPVITPDNGAGDPDDWFQDCTDPLSRDGTEWRAGLLNFIIANLRSVVRKSGQTASNLDDDILTKAIRSGGLNIAAVSGTANAITLTLDPVLIAYSTGLMVMFVTGASANTGAVTINAGPGAVALTRRGGEALEAGDLPAVSLVVARYVLGGFRLMGLVTSDILARLNGSGQVPQLNFFDLVTGNTQSVPSATVTRINDFAVAASKPSDAVFGSGGIITIGPKTAGVWTVTQYYVPSQTGGAATAVQAYLFKNGVNVFNVTVSGTFCSQSGTVRVAAGDTLDMRVYQNSGGGRTNRHAGAVPPDTTFNLYQISGA